MELDEIDGENGGIVACSWIGIGRVFGGLALLVYRRNETVLDFSKLNRLWHCDQLFFSFFFFFLLWKYFRFFFFFPFCLMDYTTSIIVRCSFRVFWKIASSDKNILKAESCVDAKFYYEMLSSKNFLAAHILPNNKFVLKLYGLFFYFKWVCKNIIFHKPERAFEK